MIVRAHRATSALALIALASLAGCSGSRSAAASVGSGRSASHARYERTASATTGASDATDEALGEPSSEAENASEQDCGRAAVLASLTDALGPEARLETREIAASPSAPAALIATVSYEDDGPSCTDTHVFVLYDACLIEIASASECLYRSYFDEHVSLGDPRFYDGGPELGTVAVLERSVSGRGDSEDGEHVDGYLEATLFVCAERRAWACIDVSIRQRRETDCMGSGGCFDSDDRDSEGLPVASERGYSLAWRIDGSALVLTPDDDLTVPPPQQGRIELRELF